MSKIIKRLKYQKINLKNYSERTKNLIKLQNSCSISKINFTI